MGKIKGDTGRQKKRKQKAEQRAKEEKTKDNAKDVLCNAPHFSS